MGQNKFLSQKCNFPKPITNTVPEINQFRADVFSRPRVSIWYAAIKQWVQIFKQKKNFHYDNN